MDTSQSALALGLRRNGGSQKSFTRFFSKNRGNGRGMSPGVRMESGHLKNRLPAIRRGRHFPQAGNRAFSQVVRLFFVAAHRLPFWKAITSENCGFVLCTKCGPCRTARKQFSKGLRSKTGVQQHPKNTQKDIFDKLSPWYRHTKGFWFRHSVFSRLHDVSVSHSAIL